MKFTHPTSLLRQLGFIAVLLFTTAGTLTAQTTWTGATSTDWATAANWSPAGVPDNTIDVIIPNTTNKPVVSALGLNARTVTVQSGGVLTITATGGLVIYGGGSAGILNQGTVNNNGIINIGQTGGFSDYGIQNSNVFNNNAGAQMNIDRYTISGIYAVSNTFNNAGTIAMGKLYATGALLADPGTGTLSNNTGGTIKGTGYISAVRLTNAGGTLAPEYRTSGNTTGTITFNQAVNFANSTMRIEVGGVTAGTNHDIIAVTAAVTLGGNLSVSMGIIPFDGVEITFLKGASISGTFSSVTGLPAGWTVAYFPDAVKFIYKTKYWTGNINTDWNTGGNWHTGTVPAADELVIIPDVTNDPVISTAASVARFVKVQPGGSLTVATTGVLTIAVGAVFVDSSYCITNRGTVVNNGAIAITSLTTAKPYSYCINNTATFDNNAGATINIDGNTNGMGALYNFGTGVFTNSGTLSIGATDNAGFRGIENNGTIRNFAGGQINIDRAANTAFYNIGTATNNGILKIGANAATGADGIDNYGVFNNNTGAQLFIDRITSTCIYHPGNSFTNQGTITMGSLSAGNTMSSGIYITKIFNNTGGQINIDRVTIPISIGDNTFNNTGVVTIGKLVPATKLLSSFGLGSFSNNTGGEVKGTGTLDAARFVNNGGKLSPGYSPGQLSFSGNESFSNSILNIELAGTAVAGTDYDQIAVTGTATLGGNLVISTINSFNLQAGQSFTILTAGSVTRTFASVTLPTGVTGTMTYSSTTATLNILTVLPLTLIEFTGEAKGNKARLLWKTADEENTAVFEVERSADGTMYSKIGSVTAMGSGAHRYSFTDENTLTGNNYYRLKMIDKDGQFTYSKTELVKFTNKGGIQIAPVPASSYIKLTINDQSVTGQRAQVYNTAGVLVANVVLTNSTNINISNWPAGIYTIKTSIGTYRFIKQ